MVGNGNLNSALKEPCYVQKEFIGGQFGHVLAAATVVVSRAGANSIYELLTTRKPHLLIPLGKTTSRGDQLDNARAFANLGFSRVLYEEALTSDQESDDVFVESVKAVLTHSDEITARLQSFEIKDSVNIIIELIQESM